MSKRINIGVSDEVYEWLSSQASENGIAVSAYATMMLNQSKRNMEAQKELSAMMGTFAKLPPELIAEEMKKMSLENKGE